MVVFKIGNKGILHKRIVKAATGRVFSEAGIQGELDKLADILEKELPAQEFRLVELSGGRFKFMNETSTELKLRLNEQVLFDVKVKPGEEMND